jgi:hypothetical protein
MLNLKVRYAFVTLVAAGFYFSLTYLLQSPAFVHLPRFTWIQENFGRLTEARIWAHSAHGLTLLVAAIPSALVIALFGRPRPIGIAAAAGCLTAVAAFAPTFLTASVRPYWDATMIGHMVVDGIKFISILMLVTWLISKLPSNYAMQRSSRVGTPLAGTGAGEDRLRSASGAPTARRR